MACIWDKLLQAVILYRVKTFNHTIFISLNLVLLILAFSAAHRFHICILFLSPQMLMLPSFVLYAGLITAPHEILRKEDALN